MVCVVLQLRPSSVAPVIYRRRADGQRVREDVDAVHALALLLLLRRRRVLRQRL